MSSDEKNQKRVVIIGAGASGIGAARTLSSAGVNVVILEGRDRIGGRMKKHCLTKNLISSSWMNAEHSVSIQLGANWIHGMEATTNPMFEVAQKLGLELHQTSSDDDPGDDVILFDSGINNSSILHKDKVVYGRVSKEDYEETLSRYEWIKEYVDRISVNYEKEDISLQTAFNLALTASEADIFGPCPPSQLRCLTWLYDRVSIDLGALSSKVSLNCYAEGVSDGAGGEGLVKHVGYAHILHHLAEEFPLDIRLNHQVTQISVCNIASSSGSSSSSSTSSTKPYEFPGITILSEEDRTNPVLQSQLQACALKDGRCVRIDCTNGETFLADACIITVPIGVLQANSIQFVPRPPSVITSVCSTLKLGLMNLVWLWFPEVFWPEECNFLGVARDAGAYTATADASQEGGCQLETDDVKFTTFLIPPMYDNYGVRQPVLMCQIVGPYATTIESMSDADIAAAATTTLRAMFGAEKVPDPIGCAHSQWGSDPFSKGSWSYFPYRAGNSSVVSEAMEALNGETVEQGACYLNGATDSAAREMATVDASTTATSTTTSSISTTSHHQHAHVPTAEVFTTTAVSFIEEAYPLQRSVSIAEAASAVRSAASRNPTSTSNLSARRYVEFSDIGCTSDGSDENSSSSSESDGELDCDDDIDFGASDLTSLAGLLSDYSSSEGYSGVRTIPVSTTTTTSSDSSNTPTATTSCIYRTEDDVISAHLYYASEAMSVLNRGTVHGAYMSGIREAHRVLTFFDDNSSSGMKVKSK